MIQVTQAYFEDDIAVVCEMAQEEPVLVHNDGEPVAVVLSPDFYAVLVASANSSEAEPDKSADF